MQAAGPAVVACSVSNTTTTTTAAWENQFITRQARLGLTVYFTFHYLALTVIKPNKKITVYIHPFFLGIGYEDQEESLLKYIPPDSE